MTDNPTVIYGDQVWTATWSAADAATLEAIIANAEPGVQFGLGVQPRTVWGVTRYVVAISSTAGPIGEPPAGVIAEDMPMLGLASPGPQRPTPTQWLDRVDRDTQSAMLDWIEARPGGRLLALRFASLPHVRVEDIEIQQIVTGLHAAKVLTVEQTQTLLS